MDSDSLGRGQIASWEPERSAYVLIMLEQVSDQTRKQIFKDTFRRKIDLRRMTSVCSGDRELARSLVVCALREIADDIETGEWDTHPVKTTNQNLIYNYSSKLERNYEDTPPQIWGDFCLPSLLQNFRTQNS